MLLDQCKTIIDKVRKQAAQTGASVSLTVLLVRIEQKISRLRVLLRLLEARPTHERNGVRVQSLKTLVRAENRRHSIRELWSQTADLLSRSEEHTSELQSLMRISYAVFCVK